MIWNIYNFLISQIFIGYILSMIYFYLWTRTKFQDFIPALTLGLFGSFIGGLIEVFYIRAHFLSPQYFLGFQYFFPAVSATVILLVYGFIKRMKEI